MRSIFYAVSYVSDCKMRRATYMDRPSADLFPTCPDRDGAATVRLPEAGACSRPSGG